MPLGIKSIREKLSYQWAKTIRIAHRYLERLGAIVSTTLYRTLGMIHLALVTDAGLLIMIFVPSLFGAQLVPKPISLIFFICYVVCDLVRLPFRYGATISLGFPLIFLTLLVDSPFAALLVATLGSWFSEVLRSRLFSKLRLSWFAALRRAFFYAGHHAVAGLGALITYQLIRGRFASWLLLENIHIQATVAYVILYSLVSMLLIWPHDRRVHLFLTPDEESFVRIDIFTTSLLLPLPLSVVYLYNLKLSQGAKIFIVVGVLPPLFVLLFLLARHFTKVEEERERLALQEEVKQRLAVCRRNKVDRVFQVKTGI